MLVSKLPGARDRKRRQTGRCEGNPAWGAIPSAHIEAAKAAHARSLSLREIAAQLAAAGCLNRVGKPYGAPTIRTMLRKAA